MKTHWHYCLFVLTTLTALPSFGQDDAICWKQNFTRGVGIVGKACPAGKSLQGGLCYNDACGSNYDAVGPICWQKCPSGFKDIGVSCEKPAARTTAGYPWKIGDPAFNYDKARDRCEAEWGKGRCYKSGLIWYPNCPEGYSKVGDNICSPNCPNGMRDDGAFCGKNTVERGIGTVPTCGSGMESDAGLCYPSCGQGFSGVGPTCWGTCPSDFPVQCGAACARSQAACGVAIGDMVLSTSSVALNMLSFGFGAATTSPIKAAAKTASNAAGKAILNSTAKTSAGLVFDAAKGYAYAYAKEFVKTSLKNKVKDANKYWTLSKLLNTGGLKGLNAAAAEFGVLKDSNTFDLTMLTGLDPTGISSMVTSFTKYGSCSGDDFTVNFDELKFGAFPVAMTRSFVITAQKPMTVTRITSPTFSNCSVTPQADCIGRKLSTGQTCTVTIDVKGSSALDAEVRIYTDSYTVVPYPVHILANNNASTSCQTLNDGDDGVNLTAVAGAWAINSHTYKMTVQSNGQANVGGGNTTLAVEDAAGRTFQMVGIPASLYLNDPADTLFMIGNISQGVIVAEHSGKALNVPRDSVADGVGLIQWDNVGSSNEIFTFDKQSDGTYRIIAAHSQKVLDIEGASKDWGARVIQSTWRGANSQRFRVEPVARNLVRIVNVNSGLVLNVSGGGSENEAAIIQWGRADAPNERFRINSAVDTLAVRRPWDPGCQSGETLFAGLCYNVPLRKVMVAPGLYGDPCPYDTRDDGTSCWPAWKGVKVAGQADPESTSTTRFPVVVTDCVNYSEVQGKSCPANFKRTAVCSCEAVPKLRNIKLITGAAPNR